MTVAREHDETAQKRAVGYAAVDRFVRDRTCIGLGTGSTARWAVERVGELVAAGWDLVAVPTSAQTEQQCRELGIRTTGPYDGPPIEVAIDGADEAAPDFSLIKGGGGALFREKAVALAARSFVVIVTESKLSATLGGFPLPVEVVQFTTPYVRREIEKICPKVTLRAKGGAPFVTDNGNHILDCAFDEIAQPAELQAGLRAIHGVVDTGLFVGIASRILVGGLEGVRELERIAR